ncbi:uncharacterized protein V1510DRAFT_430235 [Dipodascopsis tothii]|uniref:uncharacterized protein n=1 Tax=Dipodascopsis tothii TaxID=44089 RepID=UPI0034CDB744
MARYLDEGDYGGRAVRVAAADVMTVSFSMPYTCVVEPEPADTLYSSKTGYEHWTAGGKGAQAPYGGAPTLDNFAGVRAAVDAANGGGEVEAGVVVNRRGTPNITVTLSGPAPAVLAERAKVLKRYYMIGCKHAGIDTFQLLDTQGEVKAKIKQQLDKIAEYSSATIFVTKVLDASLRPKAPSQAELEDMWKPYHILVYGDLDSIEIAKLRVYLLLDDLARCVIDRFELPLSLQPLIAGRDHGNFKKIADETETKIYVPNLFPGVHAPLDKNHAPRNYNEIFISGRDYQVELAKGMIDELVAKIPVFIKDCVVAFAKIDFLLVHQLERLKDLCLRHGTFIQFPFLGSARSIIRVQSSSHIFVEKTIRAVMQLSCEVYSVSYWIHEDKADAKGFLVQPSAVPPLAPLREALERISANSGADVSFLKCTFELSGTPDATKSAVSQIRGLPFWPNNAHQIRFRVELSIDQREFIAGKKNGKIHRIMNSASVWLRFAPFSEYNFFVDLTSPNYASALSGIQLLEDELPAEISFYIPEAYHRQIIGQGGQQIQTLMRKHNVFVKFSNAYERVSTGGSLSRVDNVVVRCPAKNADSLEPAKREIIALVAQQEQHAHTSFVTIPKVHQRILLAERDQFVNEIENKANVSIKFPGKKNGELVEIKGHANNLAEATKALKDMLPIDYEFRVPYSTRLLEITAETNAQFTLGVVIPFRLVLKTYIRVTSSLQPAAGEPPMHYIRLSVGRDNVRNLEEAIGLLTEYLRNFGIDIAGKGAYLSRAV